MAIEGTCGRCDTHITLDNKNKDAVLICNVCRNKVSFTAVTVAAVTAAGATTPTTTILPANTTVKRIRGPKKLVGDDVKRLNRIKKDVVRMAKDGKSPKEITDVVQKMGIPAQEQTIRMVINGTWRPGKRGI